MFKFPASDLRKKFKGAASEVQIEEDRSASPSTQEYQKLEGKLKHDSNMEQSGRVWGVIYLVISLNGMLMM